MIGISLISFFLSVHFPIAIFGFLVLFVEVLSLFLEYDELVSAKIPDGNDQRGKNYA